MCRQLKKIDADASIKVLCKAQNIQPPSPGCVKRSRGSAGPDFASRREWRRSKWLWKRVHCWARGRQELIQQESVPTATEVTSAFSWMGETRTNKVGNCGQLMHGCAASGGAGRRAALPQVTEDVNSGRCQQEYCSDNYTEMDIIARLQCIKPSLKEWIHIQEPSGPRNPRPCSEGIWWLGYFVLWRLVWTVWAHLFPQRAGSLQINTKLFQVTTFKGYESHCTCF